MKVLVIFGIAQISKTTSQIIKEEMLIKEADIRSTVLPYYNTIDNIDIESINYDTAGITTVILEKIFAYEDGAYFRKIKEFKKKGYGDGTGYLE